MRGLSGCILCGEPTVCQRHGQLWLVLWLLVARVVAFYFYATHWSGNLRAALARSHALDMTLSFLAYLRVCFLSCSPSVVWVCTNSPFSPSANVVQVYLTGSRGGTPTPTPTRDFCLAAGPVLPPQHPDKEVTRVHLQRFVHTRALKKKEHCVPLFERNKTGCVPYSSHARNPLALSHASPQPYCSDKTTKG